MLEGLAKDFRYAARMLMKKPGFAAVAMLTLGLGIGASTAMFSVIDNVLLNPFPYKHGNQIVALGIHDTSDTHVNDSRRYFQGPEYIDYLEQSHSFQDVMGGAYEDVLYTSADGTQLFAGGVVTPNLFDFLGVPAMIGRTPTPDDVKPGATPVFAMSYKMWVKYFGQDPSIVGRSFVLNDVPTTLVGIMPPRFTKLASDLWRPVEMNRADPQLANLFFNFQGLLKPGVTPRQAEAELNGIALRLSQVYPKIIPRNSALRSYRSRTA